ncbi:MAG TPA: TonB-dependent receptor, partial [Caulobacteraceae bacterium]|nr:TonB-dependent receptor [Caulobacteraceae bacterium]
TGAPPYTPPAITIKPEHVNDYELGAKYQMGAFSAELSVYREDFSDIFIDQFDPVAYLTHVINGGDARYQGVELQLQDDFSLGEMGDLQAFLNYSYNSAKYTSAFDADSVGGTLSVADATVTPGEKVGDVPDMLASVGATWSKDGWRLTVDGRYIGRQSTLDYNTGVPDGVYIGGHMIADLGLSKTFDLHGSGMFAKSVQIGVNVDNLFDTYYFNYADTSTSENYFKTLTTFASPGAPRSVIGKITVNF